MQKLPEKDHRFKCKMVNYKIFRRKHMRTFLVIGFGEVFLDIPLRYI